MPTPSNPYAIDVPYFNRGPVAPKPLGSLPSYNVSPFPTSGQGAYGMVPGQTAIPPSTFQQTINAVPGLGGGAPNQLTANIMSELQGQINPQALKNMQDAAARFGVTSGMPGSNTMSGTLASNANLRNIGLDTLATQRAGQQDYMSALSGFGAQQLNPALLTQLSQENALLAAAPDPAQAALVQQQLYQNALNAARGPSGGTGYSVAGPAGTGAMGPSGFGPGGYPNPSTPGTFGGSSSYSADQSLWDALSGLDLPSFDTISNPANNYDPFGDLGSSYDYSGAYTNPEDYYAGILAGG